MYPRPVVNYLELLTWTLFRAKRGRMLAAGDPAPPFAVQDESGTVRTLDSFAGKTLVLWFFPKAETPG